MEDIKLVMQELKIDPFRKFNAAFALMTVIPFLVFFYLLAVRLFTLNIFIGNVGLILGITLFTSLFGFLIGYNLVKNILTKIVFYAAKAKHSDQLKSAFVAQVSHELKNPLTVIKTGLSNILAGVAGQVSVEQRKIAELCSDIIERMFCMVKDLLDLHKIEAGLIGTERKLCNLSEILEREVNELELMLKKKRIKLLRQAAGNQIELWADEGKLVQVVNNLLSNAIKYSPEEGNVTIKSFPVNGHVRLEFEDTAEHIPEDKLKKIFDKFERLDYTKEGTGLGLAITKDIIEMHKGRIWAENLQGQGNRFIVVLPRDLRGKFR